MADDEAQAVPVIRALGGEAPLTEGELIALAAIANVYALCAHQENQAAVQRGHPANYTVWSDASMALERELKRRKVIP